MVINNGGLQRCRCVRGKASDSEQQMGSLPCQDSTQLQEAVKHCYLQLPGTHCYLVHTSSTDPWPARASVHFHPQHPYHIPVNASKPLKETERCEYRKYTHRLHNQSTQVSEFCILVDFSPIIYKNLLASPNALCNLDKPELNLKLGHWGQGSLSTAEMEHGPAGGWQWECGELP